ncbi:DNA cytosine methyltransferase [Microbacterium sp. CFBP 13617]|uniref:DNA cytosine methyltransferase n=1 Tax=Microbacterium sp. CFBP 13617 TaxID=2774035 RepID=UPI00177E6758|nr:DNA cytosine methyltransferase [Microbacterium sp. CFBP 13617]MBD8218230.1 DNA cytosine methyltransferase [Microbacterium sp. CFBP 13617]
MTPRIGTSDVTMSDYYCGAGGSSTGAVAVGVRVAMAVNHWDLAIATHNTNHPDTDHDKADINKADPARYPRTTIGWFSPECTYWSQARGEKLPDGQLAWDFFGDSVPNEAADRSRMGMWDVPRFTAHHGYEIVIVENVPRVVKGVQWGAWLRSMHDLGYLHEVIWLNSMHAAGAGPAAPQSRDRVYIVFWKAGNRRPDFDGWIRPEAICPEHGLIRSAQVLKPKGSPMKTYGAQYTLRCPNVACNTEVFPAVAGADTIIDWSKRGIRIGDRKTRGMDELAEKTMLRTFHGVRRHWAQPMVIEAAGNTYDATSPRHPQHLDPDAYYRAWPADEPLRTLHTTSSKGLIVRGEGNTTPARAVEEPIGAITAAGSQFLAAPPLIMRNMTARGDQGQMSKPVTEPIGALTASGVHSLLIPMEGRDGKTARLASGPMRTQSTRNETGLLVPLRTHGTAAPTSDPMKTVVAGTVSQSLVVPLRNHGTAKTAAEPIDTVAASGNHHALVMRNNGGPAESGWQTTAAAEPLRTLTTGGHQSLIDTEHPPVVETTLTDDEIWQLVYDAEFRMLEPDEIKRGMAFASGYVLLGNKREQVRMAGNAVTPNAARDIIAACVESLGYDVRSTLALAA